MTPEGDPIGAFVCAAMILLCIAVVMYTGDIPSSESTTMKINATGINATVSDTVNTTLHQCLLDVGYNWSITVDLSGWIRV